VYRVRYYDQSYHPDEFRKGFRGWYIRALNWVRWKLETYIQLQALRYLSKEAALPKKEVGVLTKHFKLDVRAESVEKDQTSPDVVGPIEPSIRADVYQEGRQRSVLSAAHDDNGKTRPEPIDGLAARYGATTIRQRRYARGRGRHFVGDDRSFEEVSNKKASGE